MSNEYVKVWVYDKMLNRVQTRWELYTDAMHRMFGDAYIWTPSSPIFWNGYAIRGTRSEQCQSLWHLMSESAEIANNVGDFTRFGGPDKSDNVMKALERKFKSCL